jgi:hypothetical protein
MKKIIRILQFMMAIIATVLVFLLWHAKITPENSLIVLMLFSWICVLPILIKGKV